MPMNTGPERLVGQRPVVLVSPDLRPSILGVARSLDEAGLLHRLVTTLAVDTASKGNLLAALQRRMGGSVRRALGSRQVPEWLGGRVQSYPLRELARVAAQRLGLDPISSDRIWEWAETGFDRQVARDWAGRVPCIYGCEHASLETFRRQKDRGGSTVLWQVIAHHSTISQMFQREAELSPRSTTAYARHAVRSAPRVNGRKDEQYALTDFIVANSHFVRQSFIDAGIAPEKVVAIPTGCPSVGREVLAPHPGPVVFLNAGTQSIRKGSHLLLDAWRCIGVTASAQLWLVGSMDLPARLLEPLPSGVVVRPAVPRSEMEGLFQRASVLVLPTLCEGRAHVILEAVAHGLPVITTPNSGCTDVVQDGVNGWIVPVGDSEALAERLVWCLENPGLLEAMGHESLRLASSWQVSDFSAAHARVIGQFLDLHNVRLAK